MQRVLVAGATGYLGRHLVDGLKRRGAWVRALVRHPQQRDGFEGVADEIDLRQITNPSSLQGIAAGVDKVFSTIGITRQKDGLTYNDVDYQGNVNLLKEAEGSAVDTFVYISVLHGSNLRQLAMVAAKERFVDRLNTSPLKPCIIRPIAFFSDMADYLTMARRGLVPIFGGGETPVNRFPGGTPPTLASMPPSPGRPRWKSAVSTSIPITRSRVSRSPP